MFEWLSLPSWYQGLWTQTQWIEPWRSDSLTWTFRIFTQLGEAWFYFTVLPLAYWFWQKDKATRLFFVVMLASIVNSYLKTLFHVPRPEQLSWIVYARGWSFPSGHAQVGTVFCLWLALEHARPRMWFLGTIAAVGVSVSRPYLGVHTPLDVLVGALLGIALVIALFLSRRFVFTGWGQLRMRWQAFLVVALQMLLVATFPARTFDPLAWVAAATLTGFWLGKRLAHEQLQLAPITGWRNRSCAATVGLLGVFGLGMGLPMGLRALGFSQIVWIYPIFLLNGLFVAYLAPRIFYACGWAQVEHRKSGARKTVESEQKATK